MIQEVIVSTQNAQGKSHLAPMGIHVQADEIIILPFRPSNSLNNILELKSAVINYCDDVRIFAGCLNGKHDWPLTKTDKIEGHYLSTALAHKELELIKIEDDPTRPKLFFKIVHSQNHAPFRGFNRAQYSVLEAAILVSRLHILPLEKIESEIEYLKIGLDKTAGDNEREAWGWLIALVDQHKQKQLQT
ncbi:MAG: DUF447 family protein [Methylococcales symbiont of Iophon sp. n. MRB-2018]|nr:MAG: DUF447 family protein [Methylococcales symbiont of Iophon sp. n. MRB-2018]KAF3978939.1 MAG: DUF447 family protein [Methylococcales symbiont of Iophon sp. n. MRB-2018]